MWHRLPPPFCVEDSNCARVRGFSPDNVVGALEQASRARTPVYPLVASIKQLIMEDYIQVKGQPEIS